MPDVNLTITHFPTTPLINSVGEPVYFCGGAGNGGGDSSDGDAEQKKFCV